MIEQLIKSREFHHVICAQRVLAFQDFDSLLYPPDQQAKVFVVIT